MNTTLLLIVIILFFLFIETPLFTVIAALSIVCLYFVEHDWLSLQMILIELNRLATVPVLVALPLFTFVGCLLTETQSPKRIMNCMQAAFGWLPGGMAMAAVGACVFFGALTGASGVTIVALGGILYPILLQNRNPETFSLGLLTTSGSLGLLFPPSLPIILYGVVAQVPIQDIFKAALLPGILSVGLVAAYIILHHYFLHGGAEPRQMTAGFSGRELIRRLWEASWDWPILIIIIVGVYGGYVTIAEVAAIVVIYVILVACFLKREVKFFSRLPAIVIESVVLSGAIIVILGIALGFTGFLIDEQIPDRLLTLLTRLTDNRYLFLAGLNLFLLVVGCIMDIFSAIIIIVPIIAPIARTYGVDPIQLCIIFLVNLEIGYSTPPVGMNLFIASLRFEKPVGMIYRATWPYLVLMFVVLALVTYLPDISLVLLSR
ncbi:MAG: TRAP transporter large permease [Thermodesulfobacteriota bacterium]